MKKLVLSKFKERVVSDFDLGMVREFGTAQNCEFIRKKIEECAVSLAHIVKITDYDKWLDILEGTNDAAAFFRYYMGIMRAKEIGEQIRRLKRNNRTQSHQVVVTFNSIGFGKFLHMQTRKVSSVGYVESTNERVRHKEWLEGDRRVLVVRDTCIGEFDLSPAKLLMFCEYQWDVGKLWRMCNLVGDECTVRLHSATGKGVHAVDRVIVKAIYEEINSYQRALKQNE